MYDYNTDEIEYDSFGLPEGIHKVMITKEEQVTKKEENPDMLILTFEAVEGEFKGKSQIAYYNHKHTSAKAAHIARQTIKRIADATGKAVNAQSPLKGRVLKIEVRKQKENDQYMEIAKYMPENEPTPAPADSNEPPM